MGSWEATGPTSFNMTMTESDEGGSRHGPRDGEVSADGQSFTADYTIEFIEDGTPLVSTAPAK